ncbi:VOC family protein [Kordiimonas marina]|uniref:VOC family protein n=1 Tax=Kordiimonas marina TaxID=2872312 RepID=UPI001FF3D0CC|nr:VOC family protein [Kordiimonas marina]MCJ9429031.1 VOC family protein [Kordiimonas marina]
MAENDRAEKDGIVTGVGGIFFKCRDREALASWYQKKLGFPYDGIGASFLFREDDDPKKAGYLVWGPFRKDSDYFRPSGKDYMINLRVRGLDALLKRLQAAGVEQIGEVEEYDYGRFAWIMDPEGTKIELWEQKGEPPIHEPDHEPGIEWGSEEKGE